MAIHRDDLDYRQAEALTESIKQTVAEDLGVDPSQIVVQFAGDVASDGANALAPDVLEKIEQLQNQFTERFVKGQCGECGEPMPGFSELNIEDEQEWKLPEGWSYYGNIVEGKPGEWLCPSCEELGDGPIEVIQD
jgi:rubrerythrin